MKKAYDFQKDNLYKILYVNCIGKIIPLTFLGDDQLAKWVAWLDRKIEQGLCGGYEVTMIR